MIRGLCIDVAGVRHKDCALPGAIDAPAASKLLAFLPSAHQYVPHAPQPPLALLQEQGFSVKGPELITAPDAIRHQVIESQLTPGIWFTRTSNLFSCHTPRRTLRYGRGLRCR